MEAKRTASIVRWVLLVCIAVMVTSGCTGIQGPTRQGATPEVRPGVPAGYLSPKELLNSLVLIPAPPAKGSAAFALDEEVSRKSLALRGTPRWTLATEDANLSFPQAAGAFSCALKAPGTEQTMPNLYVLMRRSFADVVLSTYAAKDHYARTRPFVINKEPTCTPSKESHLMKNGSYPSGHTAIGWAWALILAEVAPEQADAILARGRAFGQSRVICNVHWQSDVIEGRVVGAGTVARLHARPEFRADVEAARVELAAIRGKGLKPTRDCQAEAAAMALEPPQAP